MPRLKSSFNNNIPSVINRDSGQNENIKTDCFGYRDTNNCCVLTNMVCKNKKCSFYQHFSEINQMKIEQDIRNYVGPLQKKDK